MKMLKDYVDQPTFHVKEHAPTLSLESVNIFAITKRGDSQLVNTKPKRIPHRLNVGCVVASWTVILRNQLGRPRQTKRCALCHRAQFIYSFTLIVEHFVRENGGNVHELEPDTYVGLTTFPWRNRSGQQVKPVQPSEIWVTLAWQTPRHSDSNDLFSAWGKAFVFDVWAPYCTGTEEFSEGKTHRVGKAQYVRGAVIWKMFATVKQSNKIEKE